MVTRDVFECYGLGVSILEIDDGVRLTLPRGTAFVCRAGFLVVNQG